MTGEGGARSADKQHESLSHVRAYLQLGLLRARLLPHVVPSIGNTLLVGRGGRQEGWVAVVRRMR